VSGFGGVPARLRRSAEAKFLAVAVVDRTTVTLDRQAHGKAGRARNSDVPIFTLEPIRTAPGNHSCLAEPSRTHHSPSHVVALLRPPNGNLPASSKPCIPIRASRPPEVLVRIGVEAGGG
jgi:hypothetical protein